MSMRFEHHLLLRTTRIFTVLALLPGIIAADTARACSTFAVTRGSALLFGRNTDSALPIPGFIIVNKRSVTKTALAWAQVGPMKGNGEPIRWTSRFGSLTFSHFGREFPDGGVNEAGLIIEEMSLDEARYPVPPSVTAMSVQQWLQYQLDNYATVEEVVRNAERLNIRGWPWHFTIADAKGHCATLEFLDGAAVVRKGVLRSGCILTNHRLDVARQQLRSSQAAVLSPTSSEGRFRRLHDMLDRKLPATGDARIRFGFETLAAVSQGDDTRRSILYDMQAGRVYFRSQAVPGVKWIDLRRLDFSTDTPPVMIEIDAPGTGDATSRLRPYSLEDNRAAVSVVFGLVRKDPKLSAVLDAELATAGLTESELVDRIATYPASTSPN